MSDRSVIQGNETMSETGLSREHAEFHNSYREENIKNDIKFLQGVYNDRISIRRTMLISIL